MGGSLHDIIKAQVYETVEQHLKKERALKGKGIKVLTLFFIDRVANYRIYNEDATTNLGKIGQWFEEAYRELTVKPIYKGLIPFDVTYARALGAIETGNDIALQYLLKPLREQIARTFRER